MKEFDRWNSNQIRVVPTDISRHYTLIDHERKRAWKAALKWALSQETDLQQTELGDAIRKELESKK